MGEFKMNGRTVVLGGWRAYLLAAAFLALVLVLLVVASVLAVILVAVAAIAFVAHRALSAVGLIRPRPRQPRGPAEVIEAEYRVVERRLGERTGAEPTDSKSA